MGLPSETRIEPDRRLEFSKAAIASTFKPTCSVEKYEIILQANLPSIWAENLGKYV